MNAKFLSSISAALVVASFVPPAIAAPLNDQLVWSAAIGTGHANSSVKPNAVAQHSSPGTPDWTATIGKGTARASRSNKATLPSDTQPIVAVAHWTSRIGSGHPFESAGSAPSTSAANREKPPLSSFAATNRAPQQP